MSRRPRPLRLRRAKLLAAAWCFVVIRCAMRFILPAVLAVALLPGSARAADTVAEVLTGEGLLAQCDSAAPAALDRCTDYIAGVVDTLMLGYRYGDHIAGFRGCVPATVPDRDVADLVIQVLRAQPERRSQAAAGIIAHVMTDAFPCPPLPKRR